MPVNYSAIICSGMVEKAKVREPNSVTGRWSGSHDLLIDDTIQHVMLAALWLLTGWPHDNYAV
jgi:hypothetical protein